MTCYSKVFKSAGLTKDYHLREEKCQVLFKGKYIRLTASVRLCVVLMINSKDLPCVLSPDKIF